MLESPEEEVLAKACEAIYRFVEKGQHAFTAATLILFIFPFLPFPGMCVCVCVHAHTHASVCIV